MIRVELDITGLEPTLLLMYLNRSGPITPRIVDPMTIARLRLNVILLRKFTPSVQRGADAP
jgi:hypothetical protein